MDGSLRERVWQRSAGFCEYCRLPQDATPFTPFHMEHVIARQHAGDTTFDNLAVACDRCNAYKGPNLAAIDPETQAIVAIFHPRCDDWQQHFRVDAGCVIGLTPIGRATVSLLNMNTVRRVELRRGSSSNDGLVNP